MKKYGLLLSTMLSCTLYADTLAVQSGWNLLSISEPSTTADCILDQMPAGSTLFKYDSLQKKWLAKSNSDITNTTFTQKGYPAVSTITSTEGFWLYNPLGQKIIDQTCSGNTITVERGPILHAVVIDSKGQRSSELGGGKYAFATTPSYPVTVMGGFIDLNRDGIVSVGDVNNTFILRADDGNVVTLVSTIAQNSDIRTWLKEQFGLSDDDINTQTPSTNRTIAAISDEIYAYSIENGLTPELITLDQLQTISADIANRIQTYTNSTLTTIQLEQDLVNNLNVDKLDITDITYLQSNYQSGGATSDHSLTTIIDSTPTSTLTEEQKNALAYMWNEEKLAKDVYFALNELYPHQTLYNIASKSETEHQGMVETLLEKYDLNILADNYEGGYNPDSLAVIEPGKFIDANVQSLYDTLYDLGSKSLTDALKVGCMVEVTDINDLNERIAASEGNEDLILVFSNLRSGSYNHYWAFDGALKALGVTDGCCSVGTDYCKTTDEYPNNMQGNGGGGGYMHGH